jgi:hypothetical protein
VAALLASPQHLVRPEASFIEFDAAPGKVALRTHVRFTRHAASEGYAPACSSG